MEATDMSAPLASATSAIWVRDNHHEVRFGMEYTCSIRFHYVGLRSEQAIQDLPFGR